jgi:hemerythrin-like metal-binding protein
MEPWSGGLEVGVPEMDRAHRAQHEQLEAAVEALARRDQAGVGAALAALAETSASHFQEEEGLMQASAFGGLKAHREAHATFVAELGKVRAELQARGLSPLFQLWFGSRLVDWVRFHVRGLDAQFARHYRAWLEEQARAAEAALVAEAKKKAAEGTSGEARPAAPPKK